MCNCLNMSEFASDFESTWIQSLLFIQMYSETLIFPPVLLCPSSLAVKYPWVSFKHTFLWRKSLRSSSSAPTTELQHTLKLIFRLQCSFHTKRRCGTNYKAQATCSNMFNHILLMRPSLIVQRFLQKYWFAALALSARVPRAVAVMKILHRKTLEIPSASSRTLISKQMHSKGKNLFFVIVSGQGFPHTFQTQWFSFMGGCWEASDLSLGTVRNTRLELLN